MTESVPAVVCNSMVHLHLEAGMIPTFARKHDATGMMAWSIKSQDGSCPDPTVSGLGHFSQNEIAEKEFDTQNKQKEKLLTDMLTLQDFPLICRGLKLNVGPNPVFESQREKT